MLGMVQMVGLGGGKQNPLHPPATEPSGQKTVATGAECRQHVRHGAAQILNRRGACMNGPQRIDQHNLAVDLGKMIPKKRRDDTAFIGFIPPFHLAPQAAARGKGGGGQRRKGQHRRSGQITGQQKSPGRAIGIPRLACGMQICGKLCG